MKIKEKKNIKSYSLFRKIKKVLAFLLISIVFILVAAFVYLFLNKEDFSRNILNELNKSQNGEVTVEEISLAPFEQFPSFSIKLGNVVYYENSSLFRNNSEKPFCQLENVFLSFNLLDLLNSEINITKMTLKGGHFRIVTYQDSTTNLYNAFNPKKDSTHHKEIEKIDTIQVYKETDKQEAIDFLAVDNLTIKDVTLEFENNVFQRKSSLLVERFKASFNRENEMNYVWLESNLKLNYYKLNDRTILKNNSIHFSTDLTYNANEKLVNVDSCNMGFDGAIFDLAGSFSVDDGEINLQINGSDKNFSILALFMKDDFIRENRKNLIKGSYYFDGIVKGKTYNEVPYIELSFGVKDVNLKMAHLDKSINNLNFNAYLTTGERKDFSEAYIKLENISADLPGGFTKGSFLVEDLTAPKVKLNWYLKTDITDFDDVFKVNFVDNLSGIITIDSDIDGIVSFDEGRIIGYKNNIDVNFEDVSITIPNAISLDKINGTIKKEALSISISN